MTLLPDTSAAGAWAAARGFVVGGAGAVYVPSFWPFHAADRLQAPQVTEARSGLAVKTIPLYRPPNRESFSTRSLTPQKATLPFSAAPR